MQVVHARCCGLDVHKKSVVACVLLTEPDGSVRRQVRTFGTMTADLLALDRSRSSMRNISRRCRVTRRMLRIANGSPIYCVMDW